jgi:hypothetical protein
MQGEAFRLIAAYSLFFGDRFAITRAAPRFKFQG